MKNKWKIGFWICLLFLIVTAGIGFYSVIDQAVTLTYMKEGYSDTESDLETIIQLLDKLTKPNKKLRICLKTIDFMNTWTLEPTQSELNELLSFSENDSLKSIEKQW